MGGLAIDIFFSEHTQVTPGLPMLQYTNYINYRNTTFSHVYFLESIGVLYRVHSVAENDYLFNQTDTFLHLL